MLANTFAAESSMFRNLRESRYIWMCGQRVRRTDHRDAAEATPRVRAYIWNHFANLQGNNDRRLIDKTPSNAFRIPFVSAIFPDAKIIHIIRDGRDNILSRGRQWQAEWLDETPGSRAITSTSRKFRLLKGRLQHARKLSAAGNLPLGLWPAVMRDAVPSLFANLLTGSPWHYGERVAGLSEIRRVHGVDVAAAVQWRETTMAAHCQGRRLGPERYLELHFEDFIEDPVAHWHRVLNFLGEEPSGGGDAFLRAKIRSDNRGKWYGEAERTRIAALEPHLRPTLEYLGYAW